MRIPRELENLCLSNGCKLFDDPHIQYEIVSMYELSENKARSAFLTYFTENAPRSTDARKLILGAPQFDDARDEYEEELIMRRDGVEREKSDEACIACGKRNVYSTRVQARSGDEGTTTIYKCNDCGKTWKSRA
jgi:DNA-directed RNA polymerase subunit M/transcription elongation factor TFIIS